MKLLSYLLNNVNYKKCLGPPDPLIETVQFDYKKVKKGDVYFALIYPGREGDNRSDGHEFIHQAIQQGAKVIVCEYLPETLKDDVTYLHVKDCFEVMAVMVSNYFDNPSRELKVIGVTGTNGKSSVVNLLNQLFSQLSYRTGLISTGINSIHDKIMPDYGTTPNAIELYRILRQMVDAKCEYCFLETTSHSLFQKRVLPISYHGTIFTSLSPDHLGYHKTYEEYTKTKKLLFDNTPEHSFVIYNDDDVQGEKMVADTKATVRSVSIQNPNADFYLKVKKSTFESLQLELEGKTITTSLVGTFNATNLLIVYATALMLGEQQPNVLKILPKLRPVGGRFNVFKSSDNKFGIVDHAHNLGGLENLFSVLRPMIGNKLITVIGCGGERVRKRSEIGKLVYEKSDIVVWTSDNPRSEEPEDIIEEMVSEIDTINPERSKILIDRKEAIIYACQVAQSGDLVLLASKGDETYQECKGVKMPFSDQEILLEQFAQVTSIKNK